ncbi:MAG: tetratricopeptide repeat protein [Myxococcota bacterium]|nr:tetratricopeptide repeat protein [Myxococcota bacterium]MBP8970114.1 tetratricopeptide repeat protein [Myxococcota bacterium]HHW97583.1 tetratricopeptide repeat protein [Oligoflexales bacterium]
MAARLAPFIVVAVSAIASYLPVFTNEFAWDDGYIVLLNKDIQSLSNIPAIFTRPWAGAVEYGLGQAQNQPYFRPVAEASMAIDWAIGQGPNPVIFHTTNLLIHVISALFLLVWLRRMQQSHDKEGTPNTWLAVAVTLFWAIHPVHTEAVNLVTYRTTLLSGLSTITVLMLLTKPGWRRIIVASLAFILGLLAKEVTLVTPALLLVTDIFTKNFNKFRILQIYLPLAIISFLYLGLRQIMTGPGMYDFFDGMTGFQRFAMIFRVFYLYIRLVILPFPLCPFYDWSILGIPTSLLEPDIFAGLLLMLAFPVVIVLCLKRLPVLAHGLTFFLVALLPVSHIIPFFDAAGERFLYVPLMGMALALLALGKLRASKRAKTILALVVLVAYALLTFHRSTEWHDSETVLKALVRDFPISVSANLGLGQLLTDADRSDEAIPYFEAVTKLAPSLAVGHGMLAVAVARTGDYERARTILIKAPPPEAQLPSAVQIARDELAKSNQQAILRALGL